MCGGVARRLIVGTILCAPSPHSALRSFRSVAFVVGVLARRRRPYLVPVFFSVLRSSCEKSSLLLAARVYVHNKMYISMEYYTIYVYESWVICMYIVLYMCLLKNSVARVLDATGLSTLYCGVESGVDDRRSCFVSRVFVRCIPFKYCAETQNARQTSSESIYSIQREYNNDNIAGADLGGFVPSRQESIIITYRGRRRRIPH